MMRCRIQYAHRAHRARPAALALAPTLALVLLGLGGLGCGEHSTETPPPPPSAGVPEPSPAPSEASTDVPRVVFLGDSLTAGYSLGEEQAFPHLVEQELERRGLPVEVINAGVSGDTSAGGLRRLDWLMRQNPDLVVVELGGNDGLRGLPLEATEANLRAVVEQARAGGARVLLVGMRIPPNYGPEYATDFAALFPRLAEELEVPLLPFLLEGVGGDPQLNLPDGIHPNAEGHRIVAETVVAHLEPLLRTP